MRQIHRCALGALLLGAVNFGLGCGEPGEPGLIGQTDSGPQGGEAGGGGVGGAMMPDAFAPSPDFELPDPPDMAEVPDAAPTGPEAPSAEINEAVDAFNGEVYFYGRNLATGEAVASRADEPVFGGELFRIFAVLTYASQVTAGTIEAGTEVTYTAEFERSPAGFLGNRRVGETFTLEQLARFTLNLGDRSAEALLIDALGGAEVVQETATSLIVPGLGRYLSPCERDRLFAEALDGRFSGVSCVNLGRYLHGDDATAITPDPFPEAPEFDDAAFRGAVAAMNDMGVSLATARAWGEVLTRLYRGTLVDATTNAIVRGLLEQSLGSGGGGDELPSPVWVSSWNAGFYAGRHWGALITPPTDEAAAEGLEPMVLVMLTLDRQIGADTGALFASVGRLVHEQLVGPVDLTPPLSATPRPDWVEGLFLVEANETANCNAMFSDDFDALLNCRSEGERARFLVDEETAGAIMIREGPQVDIAWFWTQPDGTRHRYQQRLFEGGWWAWTRSFRAFVAGNWRLDIYINGNPYMLRAFEVTE
ncbi:MAG: serine hydrolase [Bradymonadia bacterium]